MVVEFDLGAFDCARSLDPRDVRLALRHAHPALKEHNIVYDPRRPSEEFHAKLPANVRWKADNYNNLLEQPTIFYAVTLALAFLHADSGLNVGLAWAYVVLRLAHSLVQALINKVMIRFTLFAGASLVLLVMTIRAAWIVFLG